MQQIKIDNFVEYYKRTFPPFKELSEDECKELRNRIATRLKALSAFDSLDLVRLLAEQEGRHLQPLPLDGDVGFQEVILEGGIEPRGLVYLNWYRYDDIDQISFDELNKYFFDIWYPSSDDLDIFDESLDWILSISHNGEAKLITLR